MLYRLISCHHCTAAHFYFCHSVWLSFIFRIDCGFHSWSQISAPNGWDWGLFASRPLMNGACFSLQTHRLFVSVASAVTSAASSCATVQLIKPTSVLSSDVFISCCAVDCSQHELVSKHLCFLPSESTGCTYFVECGRLFGRVCYQAEVDGWW